MCQIIYTPAGAPPVRNLVEQFDEGSGMGLMFANPRRRVLAIHKTADEDKYARLERIYAAAVARGRPVVVHFRSGNGEADKVHPHAIFPGTLAVAHNGGFDGSDIFEPYGYDKSDTMRFADYCRIFGPRMLGNRHALDYVDGRLYEKTGYGKLAFMDATGRVAMCGESFSKVRGSFFSNI